MPPLLLNTVRPGLRALALCIAAWSLGCIGDGVAPGGSCDNACATAYPNVPECFAATWNDATCTCSLVALGVDSPCDDNNACTVEDRCNAADQCVGQRVDLDTHCDDHDDCTEDNCDQYAGCVHDPVDAGAPCDDGNSCTVDSRCNERGACTWTNQYVCGLCDDDADCGDAGGLQDPCDGTLRCVRGYCEVDPATVPACDSPRLDPCAVPSCADGTCAANASPDGTSCSDLSSCTKGDRCQAGTCTGTPIELAACQCSSDDDCIGFDDGDRCNGTFKCGAAGVCVFDFQSIVVCDASDDNVCSTNTCDPTITEGDPCVMQVLEDGTSCADGDRCTPDKTCQAGQCVGAELDCSGLSSGCLIGSCDRLQGCVRFVADAGSGCTPAEPCASGGQCNDEGDCVATTIGCDDDDPCTTDVCDEATGQCQFIGPDRPACDTLGACAGGVPLRCELGEYRCDYAAVAGWSAVEKCDGRDDDCDGATDDACIAGEACVAGGLLGAWSGSMQACAGTTTVASAECGMGWHVCSYATMVDALAGDNPPPGFYISASIKYDPEAGYSVIDHNAQCFEFNGVCTSAREVQAMTWDGVFGATVAYAAEAWGCDNGIPAADCDTVRFAGVMCCADECDSDDDCADASPCTTDTCVSGRCENPPATVVTCASSGVCAGLQPTCSPDGTLSCRDDDVLGWEALESTCDGLDNDCDGATDASDGDFLVAGEPCELDEGVCAGATKRAGACIEGAWSICGASDYSASSAFYEDAFEGLCDGRDNNCDGATDAGFVWSGRVVGQSCDGVGECGSGVVECAPSSVAATCSTNPNGSASGASREACNGKDDDCDGETDEWEDLDSDDSPCGVAGVCAGLPIARCNAGNWLCDTQGLPDFGSELCDGLDNDCDGDTDEGFSARGGVVGSLCGPSDCPNGVVICAPDKLSADCSSDLGPHYEVCDGIDNDCAAGTDEGIVFDDVLLGERELGETCSGRGECGAGLVECGVDGLATCSSLGGSTSEVSPEVCNGLDDDCDGHTDEGYRWNGIALGAQCTAPGECGAGVVQCAGDGARAVCSSLAGVATEACNGKDDDCDGVTDDNVVLGRDDCPQRGVCRPEMLEAICNGEDGWRCEYDTNPYYQGGNELGRCDRLDNDCDGTTDEDFHDLGEACDGPDPDLCARGTRVCDPSDATRTTCVGDYAAAEVCNGEDDDCDGQTDEVGAAGCTVFYEDKDDDQYGTVTRCACAPGGDFTATVGGDCNDQASTINPGAPEVCNGEDDDCDGKTDAADAADLIVDDVTPCELQAGVCAGTNKNASRCVGGQWQACELADYVARNAAFQAKETRCDGLDNDCNGASDGGDANIAANPPLCELQQGLCSGAVKPLSSCTAAGWAACSGAVYVAHAPAYEASVELSCDGKDNECDGLIDDDFTFTGKKVGQSCDGTGACGLGSVECNAARTGATCSTNPGASQHQDVPETCNSVDDDCDGAIDDNLELQQSPCRQVGVCTPELVLATCSDGTWDCDYSEVDDYEPSTEVSCDDQDNDCDGATDEDLTLTTGGQTFRKGDVCGTGGCAGVIVCNVATSTPGDLTCSSESSGGEICDRLDNDCDGQTDEGLTWVPIGGAPIAVGAACDGYGTCGQGVVECAQSLNAVCSTNPDGSDREDTVETCNGLDDDCDRTIDDGFSYGGVPVGQPCDGIGECGAGVVECTTATTSTCSSNPDGSATTAIDEVCNGLDDDCDGMTDEDLTVLDSPCLQVGVCQGTVIAICEGASGWKCDYAGASHYHAADELGYCDSLDNDCDGKTDEDYPQLGQSCDLPTDPDQCALGKWTCPAPVDDGTVISDPNAPTGVPMCLGDTPSPEVCGGGDEDCDGAANEEGAQGCSVYFLDGDVDGFGKEGFQKCLCAPGAVPFYTAVPRARFDCDDTNAAIHPDRPEVCNDADDNCNGQTDEGGPTGCTYFYYDFDNDDWGVSSNAMCFCFDHQAQATLWSTQAPGDCNDNAAEINPAATERCDGIDNDCDQLTDDADKAPVSGCTTYFYDNDLDQFGVTSNTQCRCLAGDKYTATANGDLCDIDLRTRPNQTDWFRIRNDCSNFDYNCSGQAELELPGHGGCSCGLLNGVCTQACTYAAGWRRGNLPTSTPIPACGEEGFFVDGCSATCEALVSPRQQRCH